MNFEKTSNPAFSESKFQDLAEQYVGTGTMTVKGTANKTLLLLAVVILAGSVSWKLVMAGNAIGGTLTIVGAIGALITGIIACFKSDKAHIFGPIYAAFEGLMLGSISAIYQAAFEGIVLSAVLLTIAACVIVFLCYRFGILSASGTFVKVITYATLGIGAYYLISILLGFFGINISVANLGIVGIIIQLVIVGIAALNLVLDFESVKNGVEQQLPAKAEWYCAFGLMVTIVWIYLEILRLLAIILKRD